MAPIYLGKRVLPSSLRYIENLAVKLGNKNCENQLKSRKCSPCSGSEYEQIMLRQSRRIITLF